MGMKKQHEVGHMYPTYVQTKLFRTMKAGIVISS